MKECCTLETNKILGKDIIAKLCKIENDKKENIKDYLQEPLYINNVEIFLGKSTFISSELNDGVYFYVGLHDINIVTFFIYFDKEYTEEKISRGLSFKGIEF